MVRRAGCSLCIIIAMLSLVLLGCGRERYSFTKNVDFCKNNVYAFTIVKDKSNVGTECFFRTEKMLVVAKDCEVVLLDVNSDTTGDDGRTTRLKFNVDKKDLKYLHRCSGQQAYNYLWARMLEESSSILVVRNGVAFGNEYLSENMSSPEDEYYYYIENGTSELVSLTDAKEDHE